MKLHINTNLGPTFCGELNTNVRLISSADLNREDGKFSDVCEECYKAFDKLHARPNIIRRAAGESKVNG